MTQPPPLPAGGANLLVRTSFTDDEAWTSLVEQVATPSPGEGFLAVVEIVDVSAYRDLSVEQLRGLLPEGEYVTFFFVADHVTLTDAERPLLAVPVPQARSPFLDEPPRKQFRVTVNNLWAVENNLSLANMDWTDFAKNTVAGVFRGF